MPVPKNTFKAALQAGELQVTCWAGLADPYICEITAGAGFDCVLLDAEHAPNDLRSITAQLQVMAARDVSVAVRPPIGETWMIKQLLDAGVQTLLVPMVESGAQAQDMVRAVTYPPEGTRGVGSGLARASDFGMIGDYLTAAREEICLVVQVESRAGLAALDDILAVEGLDGVFIGPSDLAADMGYLGQTGAAEVQTAVLEAIERIVAAGKAAGVLTLDPAFQRACFDKGARFVATDIDVTLFTKALRGAAEAAKRRLSDA